MEDIVFISTSSTTVNPQEETNLLSGRTVWVNGPVIVGAGPSGLAVGACLREQGVPFVIVDKADCIASLWQNRTYDRLKLHLPKKFCELPRMPFPDDFPEYPTKKQFITYLESYASKFDIKPQFNEPVESARYDETLGLWRVKTGGPAEYVCRWVVVATGENAENVVPDIDGMREFSGRVIHSCEYKTGEEFRGKRVVVVGSGNSGMEIALDLSNHNVLPSLVCRSSVHVLPREVLGKSTFEVAVTLLKWLPLWMVDKLLLVTAWLVLGSLGKYGLKRPSKGPLELKNTLGKSPVLDVGALHRIRSGHISVVPGISKFSGAHSIDLVDGRNIHVDCVVLATGYRSNVPSWLQENEMFDKNGNPKTTPFSGGWKGKRGLYAVGFTRRGLSGAASDAVNVAFDIAKLWKKQTQHINQIVPCHLRYISAS